jgi:hypothetical protein
MPKRADKTEVGEHLPIVIQCKFIHPKCGQVTQALHNSLDQPPREYQAHDQQEREQKQIWRYALF